jgi:hypothetical protein
MLPESIEKEKQVGRIQRENFRRAYQAGDRLIFGTDAGVYPHGDNAKQFAKMVEWGMKPIESIRPRRLPRRRSWDGLTESERSSLVDSPISSPSEAIRPPTFGCSRPSRSS